MEDKGVDRGRDRGRFRVSEWIDESTTTTPPVVANEVEVPRH